MKTKWWFNFLRLIYYKPKSNTWNILKTFWIDILTFSFVGDNFLHSSATFFKFSTFLPVTVTLPPKLAKSFAVASPIPELDPEFENINSYNKLINNLII